MEAISTMHVGCPLIKVDYYVDAHNAAASTLLPPLLSFLPFLVSGTPSLTYLQRTQHQSRSRSEVEVKNAEKKHL